MSPLTPDHPPPLWSLGLSNIEKPQVRGSKARERKQEEALGGGNSRESPRVGMGMSGRDGCQ